ncbi:hypothetical protein MKEN_00623700 [Mycena kentingensis (nom. inval.)]|nr:hypothetical protein MKEN_00623700 [Mycena kentingensis (nom. inval.)]
MLAEPRSIPPTPGSVFDIPGSYPRNSTVFATNKWDPPTAGRRVVMDVASYFPANAKAYLASYFAASAVNDSVEGFKEKPPLTPYPREPLGTDGTFGGDWRHSVATSASEYSQDASPGEFPSVPSEPPTPQTAQMPAPDDSAPIEVHPTLNDTSSPVLVTEPVPPLAGLAAFGYKTPENVSAASITHPSEIRVEAARDNELPAPSSLFSTGAKSSPSSSPSASSCASASAAPPPGSSSQNPSPPAPASSPSVSFKPAPASDPNSAAASSKSSPTRSPTTGGSTSLLGRIASVRARRGHRKAASEPAPPSSFGAMRGSASTSGPSGTGSLSAESKRTRSILRTIRAEARVLAGKVTRDERRVEEGRRIIREVY